MSKAAEHLLELKKYDFRILQAIEVGMRTSEYVPVDSIIELSKLSADTIASRIDDLHYRELIFRWKGHFLGYQLTHHGYDVLAFRALSERDIIVAIGLELGKGKESDVFFAFDPEQKKLVAKIHRVGRPSFQRSRKLRSYVGDRKHINWLYKSRLSAERETKGLELANKFELKVPKAIDTNRHVVIMEFYEGVELVNFIQLSDPLQMFNDIISEMKKLFVEAEMIHGDLSEYNIIITPEEDFLLIDFPQFVFADHPNAKEYLLRDITNICTYFERKYRIDSDPELILEAFFEDYAKRKKKKIKS
jgi:RIO kinase 2